MKKSQLKHLTQSNNRMTVVMWNILAGDWDPALDPGFCFERAKKKISTGDIIVFHDNEKAWQRMSYALPRLLDHFSQLGFRFDKIDRF
jgi:peptidoglycan/xylan/chitin deacetylase (PgdA/CDA1 family)